MSGDVDPPDQPDTRSMNDLQGKIHIGSSELGAKARQKRIETPALGIDPRLSEETQDPIPGNRFVEAGREIFDQDHLTDRKLHRSAVRRTQHLGLPVEPPCDALRSVGRLAAWRARCRGRPPAQASPETDDRQSQLLRIDWLGEVEIGAFRIAAHTVVAARPRGQQDDADLRLRSQIPRQFKSADIREVDVEDGDVIALPPQRLVERDTRRRLGDLDVSQPQIVGKALTKIMIVLHKDDSQILRGFRCGPFRAGHRFHHHHMYRPHRNEILLMPVPEDRSPAAKGETTSGDLAAIAGRPSTCGGHRRFFWMLVAAFVICIVNLAPAAAARLGPPSWPSLNGSVSVLPDPASALSLKDVLDSARQAEFRPII